MDMVIAQLGLSQSALSGETVIVTGAGGGIGFEAARALLWLGANVVVAEINEQSGLKAQQSLCAEFQGGGVVFVPTDVGEEASIYKLRDASVNRFGKVDAVLNNATIAVLGKVVDVPIAEWDASYRVNLRGPVLLARAFLPDMIERNHGVFACVSSTGTAFLGGYETFKAAQVHLANTLDAELEGTKVFAYTIGPGLVSTETAFKAIGQLAPQMGMDVTEFYELNKGAVLSVEEAGAGFAASIVLAERFHGQEISSMQVLKAADINYGQGASEAPSASVNVDDRTRLRSLCQAAHNTLQQQVDGWKARSLFERQWVLRDFKKAAGMPVEEWLVKLTELEQALGGSGAVSVPPLEKLADYYNHLAEVAKGYERDAAKLEDNLRHVYAWRDEVVRLSEAVNRARRN